MVLFRVIGILAAILGSLCIYKGYVTTEPSPELEVPERIDLGHLELGKTAKIAVPLKNLGVFPIEILRVYSSCSCTTSSLSDAIIQPGSQNSIDVAVQFSSLGKNESSVTLVFHFAGSSRVLSRTVAFAGVVAPSVQKNSN